MTKIEFGLILALIDKHTTTHTPNYYLDNVRKSIEDVTELKADLINHYEEFMKEDNE